VTKKLSTHLELVAEFPLVSIRERKRNASHCRFDLRPVFVLLAEEARRSTRPGRPSEQIGPARRSRSGQSWCRAEITFNRLARTAGPKAARSTITIAPVKVTTSRAGLRSKLTGRPNIGSAPVLSK